MKNKKNNDSPIGYDAANCIIFIPNSIFMLYSIDLIILHIICYGDWANIEIYNRVYNFARPTHDIIVHML